MRFCNFRNSAPSGAAITWTRPHALPAAFALPHPVTAVIPEAPGPLNRPTRPQGPMPRGTTLAAVGIAIGLLVLPVTARGAWEQIAEYLSLKGKPDPAAANVLSEHEIEGLDSMVPQD